MFHGLRNSCSTEMLHFTLVQNRSLMNLQGTLFNFIMWILFCDGSTSKTRYGLKPRSPRWLSLWGTKIYKPPNSNYKLSLICLVVCIVTLKHHITLFSLLLEFSSYILGRYISIILPYWNSTVTRYQTIESLVRLNSSYPCKILTLKNENWIVF